MASVYSQYTPELIKIRPGKEEEDWQSLATATEGRLTPWGIAKLRSGLNGHALSVLVEPLYVCKDYRNLFSNFYSKKFVERSSYCSRLHFFNTAEIEAEAAIFNNREICESYIGYSVIEPVTPRCIGRTVLDPFKLGFARGQHFCLSAESKVKIHGADYSVNGFPYRSQSAEAIVCAHTALWCSCRYLSEKYREYKEVYPYEFIEMTGDTNGRRVPYHGLTYSDYSKILSEFGCHPAIIRPKGTECKGSDGQKYRDWTKDLEKFYDLYSYVESGFPVLASFGGHVIIIIGHTLNASLPAASKADKDGFYNSAWMVRQYIVVDDNFFPYRFLAYRGRDQYYGDGYRGMDVPISIDSIMTAVVPLPEKAFLRPTDARRLACQHYSADDAMVYLKKAVSELKYPDGDKMILRSFLTSGSAFQRRKRDYFAAQPTDELLKFPISLNLPHFVWVAEVSTPKSRETNECFAELVVDATTSKHAKDPIYIRIGRTLYAEGFEDELPGCPFSFPQFTHNLGRL